MLVETYLICKKIQEQYQIIEKYDNQDENIDNASKTAAIGVLISLILLAIFSLSIYIWAIYTLIEYGNNCSDPSVKWIALACMFIPGLGPIVTLIILYVDGCVRKGKRLKKKRK